MRNQKHRQPYLSRKQKKYLSVRGNGGEKDKNFSRSIRNETIRKFPPHKLISNRNETLPKSHVFQTQSSTRSAKVVSQKIQK